MGTFLKEYKLTFLWVSFHLITYATFSISENTKTGFGYWFINNYYKEIGYRSTNITRHYRDKKLSLRLTCETMGKVPIAKNFI